MKCSGAESLPSGLSLLEQSDTTIELLFALCITPPYVLNAPHVVQRLGVDEGLAVLVVVAHVGDSAEVGVLVATDVTARAVSVWKHVVGPPPYPVGRGHFFFCVFCERQ